MGTDSKKITMNEEGVGCMEVNVKLYIYIYNILHIYL